MEKQFIDLVRITLRAAGRVYSLDMSKVDIRLDIRGATTAGQAVLTNDGQYILRFHPDAVANHYDRMVNEVIPHEVAHIVCMMRPELGCNHDYGWKQVCKTLGGTSERCHDMQLGKKRKMRKFLYKVGEETVVLSAVRHNRLQRLKVQSYIIKQTGTTITHNDYVEEITE